MWVFHHPVLLTFGVYVGCKAPFGDMLLGKEYIKERPTFMWGHKLNPNKTPGMLFLLSQLMAELRSDAGVSTAAASAHG